MGALAAEIPLEQLDAAMDELSARFNEAPLTDALRQCGDILRRGFSYNFSQGSSPSSDWPPHAPATIKRYGPHPLLVLTGNMLRAVTMKGQPGNVELIGYREMSAGISRATIPYAGAQNFGWGNIPQREYLDVDRPTEEQCYALLGHALDELLQAN